MKKEEIHIDSDFIDHSWQEMAKVLDEEMPVKKRKRRFIWLWFLGIGLMLGIVCEYYRHTTQPAIVSTKIAEKEISTHSNSPHQPNEVPSTTTKTTIHNSLDLTDNKESSDDVSTTSIIKKLTFTSSSEAKQPTLASEAGILNPSPTERTNAKNDYANYTPISNFKPIQTEQLLLETKSKIKASKQVSFVDNLPSLNFPPLKIRSLPVTFTLFHQMPPSKWHFGIYAGKLIPKLGSFRAGLHAQYQFNSKWSLFFGLGYSKRVLTSPLGNSNQELDATTTVTTTELPEADDTMMGNSSGTAGTGPAPPPISEPVPDPADVLMGTTIRIENIHYVEIPLLLQYQLNPRLSIELGGQISRVYGYRYYTNQISNAGSFFTSDLNATKSEFTRTSNTNITNISAWELSALGSIGYQLHPNLQAYSTFHYGVNSYLKSGIMENNAPKRRQIEVGIRYYFK